jgi:hypothetical protein
MDATYHDMTFMICCNLQESESIEFLGPIPLEHWNMHAKETFVVQSFE